MNLRLPLAATSAILALSSVAAAQQPWLQDRRYGEGIGLRAGNFELHPSVSAEFGYDSNYFQRSKNEVQIPGTAPLPVEDAWRLRVTPSLTLSTLKERRLGSQSIKAEQDFQLSANAYASYNELFGSDEISE